MILVTGAAGKTGLAVIRGLKEKGAHVRGLIHQDSYSDVVLAAGADEILHGDLLNKKEIQRAMDGVLLQVQHALHADVSDPHRRRR